MTAAEEAGRTTGLVDKEYGGGTEEVCIVLTAFCGCGDSVDDCLDPVDRLGVGSFGFHIMPGG